MGRLTLGLGLIIAALADAAAGELFMFSPSSGPAVKVSVDANRRAERPVSRLLYGKFAEHLGRNIYQGMWAQLLVNPGFEPAEFWGRRAQRIGAELAFRLQWPKLIDASRRGAPPGWMGTFGDGGSCRAEEGPRTGRQCVRMESVAGGPRARLAQPVFLPLHRVRNYEWSIDVRSPQAGRLTVRLRSGAGAGSAAEQSVSLAAGPWKKYTGRVTVPKDLPPHEPLIWEIQLVEPAVVWVDQCFLFPADNLDGWDPDVVRMVRDSHLPLLRWPGGNFASGYHWKDGIGPVDDRPMRLNRPWNMPEPNHVGVDEFMRFCELVGAEPMICVNAGDGTAEEAAEWVEYCNGSVASPLGRLRAANGHPQPYGVRYWEIGNELYGRWQIGHCTADQYAERYRRFAQAMKRRDPSIRLIANGHDRRWNQVLVDRCADLLSRVSLHTLIGGGIPPQSDPRAVWRLVVGYPWVYRQQLAGLAEQLRSRAPGAALAITELQIFTNRPNLPNNGNLAEALFWAGIVHAAIRAGDRVELITHSALVNHGGGLRKVRQVVYANPVYWARRMYSTQPGRWPVAVRLEGPAYSAPRLHNLPALNNAPLVDVLALTDDDSSVLSLLAINRDGGRSLPAVFSIEGFKPAATARWHWLTGPDILAANSLQAPDEVRVAQKTIATSGSQLRLSLPARSVSVITLRADQ